MDLKKSNDFSHPLAECNSICSIGTLWSFHRTKAETDTSRISAKLLDAFPPPHNSISIRLFIPAREAVSLKSVLIHQWIREGQFSNNLLTPKEKRGHNLESGSSEVGENNLVYSVCSVTIRAESRHKNGDGSGRAPEKVDSHGIRESWLSLVSFPDVREVFNCRRVNNPNSIFFFGIPRLWNNSLFSSVFFVCIQKLPLIMSATPQRGN